MGVPRFYRWISQRYPCINQMLRPNEVVHIDHLYLDLNGIIHSSSHPDDTAFKSYNEEEVFQTIAGYVKHVIYIIKPRKTIFLAVDGVAPRAKMTQQRARRFVGPRKMASELKKLKEKGVGVDASSLFDPNVISPGTEFMVRLHDFFKKFIANQISSDPLWRHVEIIYSGHNVPGEGEQKIREYMSYQRSLPQYRPNERHCLYGMDADLIFLGLATHEPNLCVLRENVYTVKSPNPPTIPFCLVHLSLLREYIGLEFQDLQSELPFPFEFERLIDDWIFMAYLLGNDFIPHLPNMHIHLESMLHLWDTYHVVLPKLDGFLIEFGKLNLERFHVFLTELSKFEKIWFEERQADQRWMQSKHGCKVEKELKNSGWMTKNVETKVVMDPELKSDTHTVDDGVPFVASSGTSDTSTEINKEETFVTAEGPFDNEDEGEGSRLSEEEEDDVRYEVWHCSHKPVALTSEQLRVDEDEDEDVLSYRLHRQQYYLQKFKINAHKDSKKSSAALEVALFPICREYVRALQWVLDYYFTSVPDWEYYYPYHYAPFVSDLLIFTRLFVENDVDRNGLNDWPDFKRNTKPLLPFEQQMFIMPAASAKILPPPYRWLLTSSDSPVSEFFPDDFEVDINGKLADWEAVILIPFIDETKMLTAVAECTKQLSPEDAKRNVHRGHLVLRIKDRKGIEYPVNFESLVSEEINHDFFRTHVLKDPEQCLKVYCQIPRRVDLWFPSFYRIPFTHKIERVGVQVFSFPSKNESISLTVKHPLGRIEPSSSSLRHVAENYLGRVVLTGWPHSRLVVPIALLDENEIWMVDSRPGECNADVKKAIRVVERTWLRERADAPFWVSLDWLRSKARWSVSRLHDHCAITFAGEEPRAALLCSFTTGFRFYVTVSKNDRSRLNLRPLNIPMPPMIKLAKEPKPMRLPHKLSRINKQSLFSDANISVAFGSEASLEILDLTIDPFAIAVDSSLLDVFPLASRVLVFAPQDGNPLKHLGEIVGSTSDNKLIIQLFPEFPLPEDPDTLLATAREADESAYLTLEEISRELHLPRHVVHHVVDNFIVRMPPLPTKQVKRSPYSNALENGSFNIAFGLCQRCKMDFVLGWSRYSESKNTWLFSRRTVKAIAKYNQLFPEVIYFMKWIATGSAVSMSDIFPENTFECYTRLRTFLHKEVKSNRTITNTDALVLDTAGLLVVQNALFSTLSYSSRSSTDCARIDVSPTDVMAVLPEGGCVVPQIYEAWHEKREKVKTFEFLERVVYVGPRAAIFGLSGFVIGVYSVSGEETVEVMFDSPFNDAVSIRGSQKQCAIMAPCHLLHYPSLSTSVASIAITTPEKRKVGGSIREIQQKQQVSMTDHPEAPSPTMKPIDSVLPSEKVINPPVTSASLRTTIGAFPKKKGPKPFSASKESPSQAPSYTASNNNVSNLQPSSEHLCKRSQDQRKNRQATQQSKLGDQATLSKDAMGTRQLIHSYLPGTEGLVTPQAPPCPPPGSWSTDAFPNNLPSAMPINAFPQLPPSFGHVPSLPTPQQPSTLLSPIDKRYTPYWCYPNGVCFLDTQTCEIFSVEQMMNLYSPWANPDPWKMDQLWSFSTQQPLDPQYFAHSQHFPDVFVPTRPLLSETADVSTGLPTQCLFVPTQVKQASVRSGLQ